MVLPPRDFESRASTNSAIPARRQQGAPLVGASKAPDDLAPARRRLSGNSPSPAMKAPRPTYNAAPCDSTTSTLTYPPD